MHDLYVAEIGAIFFSSDSMGLSSFHFYTASPRKSYRG